MYGPPRVVDTKPASPTYPRVVVTNQHFDRTTKATRFNEPNGFAFANNDEAHVALPSETQSIEIDDQMAFDSHPTLYRSLFGSCPISATVAVPACSGEHSSPTPECPPPIARPHGTCTNVCVVASFEESAD